MRRATRRGVDVRLLVPRVSDIPPALYASQRLFERYLRWGIRIFEWPGPMMHAKTAVIDGVFSTVGSSNMDWRSFVANNEINAIVMGREFGQQLEALFKRDLTNSRAIEMAAWGRRDVGERFMEQMGRLAERLL